MSLNELKITFLTCQSQLPSAGCLFGNVCEGTVPMAFILLEAGQNLSIDRRSGRAF